MNDFNEHKDDFNKRFLIKLVIFMFFYRFYAMHIDKKGLLLKYADEFLDSVPASCPIETETEMTEYTELELD